MNNLKFNGVLEEIKERYPNIDITQFLQEKLHLPNFRAEELAARIEKEYFQKSSNKTEQKSVRRILEKTNKSELPTKTNPYSIDCLSEKEFELLIEWLLEELCYEIKSEKHQTHLGIDVVAKKDNEAIAISARRYPKTYKVSESILLISQEAKRIDSCQRSIVLITTYFTQQAKVEAQSLNIELWDRDTLASKINEVRKRGNVKVRTRFPQFNGSLLKTLLNFEETGNFFIEPRTGGRYDLHLSGVKFPLLTFQAQADKVIRCIFRIKNNKPVGEHEGTTVIGNDCENNGINLDEVQAYGLIIQYLEEFMK